MTESTPKHFPKYILIYRQFCNNTYLYKTLTQDVWVPGLDGGLSIYSIFPCERVVKVCVGVTFLIYQHNWPLLMVSFSNTHRLLISSQVRHSPSMP